MSQLTFGINNVKSFTEQTRAQIPGEIYSFNFGYANGGVLEHNHHLLTIRKIRQMRRDPTIRLARALSIAPLLASKWSIEALEGAPDGAQDFIKSEVMGWRELLLRTSLFGCFDFGWQPYEKIWTYRPDSGRIGIRKIKPLIQDVSSIMVDVQNGSFAGIRNSSTPIGIQNSLLVNQNVEGSNWYGESTMSACEQPYDDWNRTNESSRKYSEKMAGAHWVIHYPPGKTMLNGASTENSVIARGLIRQLESNGSFVVPRTIDNVLDSMNKDSPNAWRIELLETDSSANAGFNDKLSYHDKLKVRATELPERAVLEGQFGTKAEAEAHADFALVNMELKGDLIIQQYNWHLVNQLLRMNWGSQAENTVVIKRAPIVDATMIFLRTLYSTFFATPEGIVSESAKVNWEAMRERLGLPALADSDVPEPDNDDFDALLKQVQQGMLVN